MFDYIFNAVIYTDPIGHIACAELYGQKGDKYKSMFCTSDDFMFEVTRQAKNRNVDLDEYMKRLEETKGSSKTQMQNFKILRAYINEKRTYAVFSIIFKGCKLYLYYNDSSDIYHMCKFFASQENMGYRELNHNRDKVGTIEEFNYLRSNRTDSYEEISASDTNSATNYINKNGIKKMHIKGLSLFAALAIAVTGAGAIIKNHNAHLDVFKPVNDDIGVTNQNDEFVIWQYPRFANLFKKSMTEGLDKDEIDFLTKYIKTLFFCNVDDMRKYSSSGEYLYRVYNYDFSLLYSDSNLLPFNEVVSKYTDLYNDVMSYFFRGSYIRPTDDKNFLSILSKYCSKTCDFIYGRTKAIGFDENNSLDYYTFLALDPISRLIILEQLESIVSVFDVDYNSTNYTGLITSHDNVMAKISDLKDAAISDLQRGKVLVNK